MPTDGDSACSVYAFDKWDAHDPRGKQPRVPTDTGPGGVGDAFQHMRGCQHFLPFLSSKVTARSSKPWEGQGRLNEMTFGTAFWDSGSSRSEKRMMTGTIVRELRAPLDRPD